MLSLWPAVAAATATVQVRISGIEGEPLRNAEIFLGLYQQRQAPSLSEARIRTLHRKAPQQLAQALQPFGYYRPVIQSELQQLDATHWQASYHVIPGPPLPIHSVDFRISGAGSDDPEFSRLRDTLPLRAGHTLNHAEYEDSKTAFSRSAIERGYFDARFTEHEIKVDLDAYRADIVLHFDTGERYRFGSLSFRDDLIKPDLLVRYSPFTPGDPYNNKDLIDLQRALSDSDYFHNVEVHPLRGQGADYSIPIEIQLTPRKRNKYTFGLGYGSDSGIRGMLGWEMPRVNRHGHRFESELRASEIGDSARLRYHVPIHDPRTDQLVYGWSRVREKTDTSTTLVYSASAAMIHARGRWHESLAVDYHKERYSVANDSGSITLVMPNTSWSRIWAASRLQPRRGMGLRFELRASSKLLLSDIDFMQVRTHGKLILPLGARGRVLLRGDAGTTAIAPVEELPASVRFFTGGAQSVRGYAYQSLGPADSQGKVIGGKHLLVGSAEYEYTLRGKFSAALFYDAGNALDGLDDPLKHGAGFGLRWQSPIGPVRIDLASALSLDKQPWRLHINIGPDL